MGSQYKFRNKTTTVRSATVSHPLHPDQTQLCPVQGASSSSALPSAEGEMDRSEGQQRLGWPGGVVLHSHGAGRGRGGHSERQPQDPASYHKVPPRSETVPTGSLPQLHMCTYQHTCTHPYTWRCPHMHTQILIHAHTHATHECDFLGTYSHMST